MSNDPGSAAPEAAGAAPPKHNPTAGETNVWLCSLGLAVGLSMVVALLSYIAVKGLDVFWPKPIRIYEVAKPGAEGAEPERERYLAEFRRAQTKRLPGEEPVEESNLFVGSREIGGAFRWVLDEQILSAEKPESAMRIERMELGHAIGLPMELRLGDERVVAADDPEFWRTLAKEIEIVTERRAEIRRLERNDIGAIARKIRENTLAIRGLESDARLSDEERDARVAAINEENAALTEKNQALIAQARELRDRQHENVLVYDIVRREAPVELHLGEVVSIERPNQLGAFGKLGTFGKRFWSFVSSWPRDANTDGGIWPAIFGTFVMTVIMSLLVTPFGVIAAIYLREYAKQGLVVKAVRISVNNLAGVPSIVFGVFGVGFFIYTVGGFIDGGSRDPFESGTFWVVAVLFIFFAFAAVVLSVLNFPKPGQPPVAGWRRALNAGLWIGSVVLLVAGVWKNPFFGGFYANALPTPTFGTGGIFWASLTLALLTLPVVIVATEEALAAVPRGVREAALACGASKWQTIQRIVLPSAAPGILTGVILAMARGAGEVAPLMLVGVIPAASELVIDGVAPFIHVERKFMHLGFHIFDVGFQSPDSEAARPLVFATTFFLITLVVLMNLAAISIRNYLRERYKAATF
jgi:phosphate transport system permease protein